MEDAFATVVWVVAAVGAIVAVFTLVGTARSYEQIGGGGIAADEDGAGDDDAPRRATAERDAEIRQLLEARNARRTPRRDAAGCRGRARGAHTCAGDRRRRAARGDSPARGCPQCAPGTSGRGAA